MSVSINESLKEIQDQIKQKQELLAERKFITEKFPGKNIQVMNEGNQTVYYVEGLSAIEADGFHCYFDQKQSKFMLVPFVMISRRQKASIRVYGSKSVSPHLNALKEMINSYLENRSVKGLPRSVQNLFGYDSRPHVNVTETSKQEEVLTAATSASDNPIVDESKTNTTQESLTRPPAAEAAPETSAPASLPTRPYIVETVEYQGQRLVRRPSAPVRKVPPVTATVPEKLLYAMQKLGRPATVAEIMNAIKEMYPNLSTSQYKNIQTSIHYTLSQSARPSAPRPGIFAREEEKDPDSKTFKYFLRNPQQTNGMIESR